MTRRSTNAPKRYGRNYDCIFYYSKGGSPTWNTLTTPYSEEYSESHYCQRDERGDFTTRDLSAPDHGMLSSGLRYQWKGGNPPSGRTWTCIQNKKDYPKLQILTIETLLVGATVRMPPTARTYKKAQKETILQGEQQQLL